MPVTIRPSSRTAESWGKAGQLSGRYTHASSAEALLSSITSNGGDLDIPRRSSPESSGSGSWAAGGSRARARGGSGQRRGNIVQSSFSGLDLRSSTTFASKNGLVHACIEAYNEHHNLVIRPDDVWLAILTQLSVHVNANAEELRPLFVDTWGQRALHVEVELKGLDHGAVARQMTQLLGLSVRDPGLREWVLPSFSTTEDNDETVASIVFMGTMKKYFTYSWGTRCGIPAATLLGCTDDWVDIVKRCEARLGRGAFGPAAECWWSYVLRPVLDGFVETFRNPEGPTTQNFWRSIVDEHQPNGSGSTTYSGWITAFCYWNEDGRCLHNDQVPQSPSQSPLPSSSSSYSSSPSSSSTRHSRPPKVALTLGEIPMGFVRVPVTLLDNGVSIETELVAGSVGLQIGRSRDSAIAGQQGSPSQGQAEPPPAASAPLRGGRQRWEGYDTIQPASGWFMYRV